MKNIRSAVLCLAIFMSLFCITSCVSPKSSDELWENAIYTENAEFGEGSKTVLVEVKAGDKAVTFTVHTDEQILGTVLAQYGLIEGDAGPYGLYIKKVNGINADFDEDKSYWSFYKDGEYMMTGIDMTEFESGEHYELVYTR